jgi:hypothetical protein
MDITLEVDSVDIRNGYKKLRVTLDNVDERDLLAEVTVDDCIEYFGKDEFLDSIGETEVIKYFGLILKEDN